MTVTPPELQTGLNDAVAAVPELLVHSIEFDVSTGKWLVRFALNCVVSPNSFIPSQTHWYALVAPAYPYGSLELHPAMEGGIQVTFPHQSINIPIPGKLWRNGKICVRTGYAVWERAGYDQEPYTASERLSWHLGRAVQWLKAAAAGQLVQYGDPFELPDVPVRLKNKFAFQETGESFAFWFSATTKAGLVEAVDLIGTPYITIKNFKVGKENLAYQWGTRLTTLSGSRTGIWVLLPEVPVVSPWQNPLTWTELYHATRLIGVDLRTILYQHYCSKSGKACSFILLGYPIPEVYGQAPERIHWQAIGLPPFPQSNARPSTPGYYDIAFKKVFPNEEHIKWANSENWAKDQITTRGTIKPEAQSKNVLLIGCGAVGSLVAELLVRLGISRITVLDRDKMEVGNFSRHTLDMSYLGQSKAEAMAARLNALFPHVVASADARSLSEVLLKDPQALHIYDVIIDATASDPVLFQLESAVQPGTHLISIATGYGARRLYLFTTLNVVNLLDRFSHKVQPWLDRDNEERLPGEEPREGIGCWHPLLPARYDNITLLIGAAISHVELFLNNGESEPRLTVFEIEKDEKGQFGNLKCIQADAV